MSKQNILPVAKRLELARKLDIEHKDLLVDLLLKEQAGTLAGVYKDIPSEIYHHPLCPGWSFSVINKCVKSVMTWLLAAPFENEAMRLGTMFHTLALEPEHFYKRHSDINAIQRDQLQRMLECWYQDPRYQIIRDLDEHIEREVTIFALCPITGLWRKCRPDILIRIAQAFIDLKTTNVHGEDDFCDRADAYAYEGQAAFYQDTAQLAGIDLKENYQWAISRGDEPKSHLFSYEESFLEAGRARYIQGLENISKFLRSHESSEQKVTELLLRGSKWKQQRTNRTA